MSKSMVTAALVLLVTSVFGIACEPEPVGAPCTPETDKGTFNKDMANTTFAVETRSVQCETAICVTKTDVLRNISPTDRENGLNDYEIFKASQTKYSFCSCRCMDADGHKADNNNDKYDDLCECPPNTKCIQILGNNIADAPEKVKGSYCIPSCIAEGCTGERAGGTQTQVCTPSSDSKEPWQWKCKFP